MEGSERFSEEIGVLMTTKELDRPREISEPPTTKESLMEGLERSEEIGGMTTKDLDRPREISEPPTTKESLMEGLEKSEEIGGMTLKDESLIEESEINKEISRPPTINENSIKESESSEEIGGPLNKNERVGKDLEKDMEIDEPHSNDQNSGKLKKNAENKGPPPKKARRKKLQKDHDSTKTDAERRRERDRQRAERERAGFDKLRKTTEELTGSKPQTRAETLEMTGDLLLQKTLKEKAKEESGMEEIKVDLLESSKTESSGENSDRPREITKKESLMEDSERFSEEIGVPTAKESDRPREISEPPTTKESLMEGLERSEEIGGMTLKDESLIEESEINKEISRPSTINENSIKESESSEEIGGPLNKNERVGKNLEKDMEIDEPHSNDQNSGKLKKNAENEGPPPKKSRRKKLQKDHDSSKTDAERRRERDRQRAERERAGFDNLKKTTEELTGSKPQTRAETLEMTGDLLLQKTLKESQISSEQLEEYFRTGGKTTVRHALGVVVGCGGAGKTTLLQRLMGKSDNDIDNIKPTRGIEIHEHIFVIKGEDLIVKDATDSRKRLLGVSRHALESNKKNADPAGDYCTDNESIKNRNDDPAEDTDSPIPNSEDTQETTSLHESEKKAIKDILQTVQDQTTVSMIDFAGQFAYYACHQIYLRPNAFFILVLNMEESFKENEGNCSDSKKNSNIYSTWTNKDYTKFWLDSIKSFGGENAPVLLVLTHTEGKSDKDVDDFKKGFWRSLPPEIRDRVFASTKGKMFAFGLKEMNESSKKSLQQLQTSIVDVVSRKLNTELELPSSWALLEYFLREKEDPVLSLEDVNKINLERPKEYQLGNASEDARKEISDFLSFLHSHGLLLYFDEERLKTHVFLHMQWFADAFSKLITDKPEECSTIYIDEWESFDKTGELKKELVDVLWKEQQYLKHKTELMSYMARLRMIVNVESLGKDISWYVPCMNKKPFHQSILNDNRTSILSFRLNSFALFEYYRLVADCMSKWTVETDEDGLCLYHTAAMFEHKNHTVVVGIYGNDIQVQVRRIKDLNPMVSREVGECVENALDELTKTFNEGKTYQKGYKCLNIFCNDEDQTFIPASKFTEITGNVLQCCCPVGKKHEIDVQKTMGWWKHCPQSKKRLPEDSMDSERKRNSHYGMAYPFSKRGHPVDVMTSRIKADVSKSVGLIYVSGKKGIERGTGFRVGSKYIMTCLHVIEDIVKDDCSIDAEKALIDFGMVDARYIDEKSRFHFEATLCQNKEFDLAILELKPEFGKSFPPQLILSRSLDLSSEVHLIGHPGGVEMKEDSGVYVHEIQPDNHADQYIRYLSQWSKDTLPRKIDYYEVLREKPRKILFHTTFDFGSSGGPGIMIQNYKPYVVLMVRGCVPICLYEKNVEKYVQDVHDKRIEYGYAMEDIFKEMAQSTNENIKEIAAEIFTAAD